MTRIKKFVISLLAIMALVCTLFSVTAFADGATIKDASTFESWTYGATVTRPTAKLEFADDTKDAVVTVLYPNGTTSSEDVLKLTVEGKYYVEYSAEFEGVTHTVRSEPITVTKPLYYAGASTVQYGTYKYNEHIQGSLNPSTNKDTLASEVVGLEVNLAKGNVFEYGKVIDLKGKTAKDILVKLAITPNTIGVMDVSTFQIILTDAYDPTNYITIETRSQQTQSINYVASWASNGQQPTGFNWNNDSKYLNDAYGTVSRFNLHGLTESSRTASSNGDEIFTPNLVSIADNAIAISMNYAERTLHNVWSPHSGSDSKASDGIANRYNKNSLLVDLNDPTHFEKAWEGFTTGECFLSIKGGAYDTDSFRFVITNIFGETDLSTGNWAITDRGTQQVKVETGEYGDNIPGAMVGRAYKLFDASCLSPYYGPLTVNAIVTGPSGEVEVVDGAFTPTVAGAYEIKYLAKDYLENEYVKVFNITAFEESAVQEFKVLYLDEDSVAKTGIAGVKVDVAEVGTQGGLGFAQIIPTVTCDTEEVEVVDGKFFPTHACTYTVTIKAIDYVGTEDVITYDVVIGAGDKPVYLSSVVVPKYLISGSEYTLPEIQAYDYTDGSGAPVDTKVAFVDANGVNLAIGKTIKPVADEYTKTVDIIYYTNSYNAEGNLVFEDIPLVDIYGSGNKIDLTKMFMTYNLKLDASAANTTVSFSGSGNDFASMEFINPLGANGLSVRFKGVEGKAAYEHVVFTLTDSVNEDQQVNLVYSPVDATMTHFRINSFDSVPYEAQQSLSANHTLAFTVDTYNKTVRFDLNSSSTPTISTYLNGKEFQGFSSGKVYVGVTFLGIKGASEMVMVSLSGQAITSRGNNAPPTISIEGEYMGFKNHGDVARIPAALFTDALDPEIQGVVTVKLPNGSYATAEDGTYLYRADCTKEYALKLLSFGSYVVSFSATDSMNKTTTFDYLLNVVDSTAPEIIVDTEKLPTGGVVGELITLPTAIAKDNQDGYVDVTVVICSTAGQYYNMVAEKEDGTLVYNTKFKPNKAGIYRAIYVARDAANNMAVEYFEFVVTNA